MGKIESEVIRVHQRTLLLHMCAQHFPEREMKKMGCSMMEGDGFSGIRVYNCLEFVSRV